MSTIKPSIHKFIRKGKLCVNIVNPVEGKRIPRDCVLVVDKSTSMEAAARIKTAKDVHREDHGLTVWDITRHAVITSLYTMLPEDRASIVLFSYDAETITPLQPMTDEIRNVAVNTFKNKSPGGNTNLYSGIKAALAILENRTDKSREATILIFTDGVPNERPPLGEEVELQNYVRKNEGNIPSLHTFGFGNTLMSDLLYNLAVIGNGSYNFIPDPSFLGTVFINSIANIFASYTSNTRIFCNNKTINLGQMQYGQNIWQVFDQEDQDVLLTFSQGSELHNILCSETSDDLSSKDDIFSRYQYINTVRDSIKLCQSKQFNNAMELVKDCKQKIEQTDYGIGLIKDLEGEILKAVTERYYSEWGKHWLYSILRAHELQLRNNFLDPGVQSYGGNLYRELMQKANDIFNSLPPPKPSIKLSNTVQCQSMSYYNSSSNPCFAGDCLVSMSDAKLKKVEDIKKGDLIKTEFGEANVLCVLKTHCKNGEADLMSIYTKNSIMRVTPLHPIKWEGKWVHPIDLIHSGLRATQPCSCVYSFLINGIDHTMIINGIVVITLAHGQTTGILDHWYYGTERVSEFLSECPGWNDGLVELRSGCTFVDAGGNFRGLVYNF